MSISMKLIFLQDIGDLQDWNPVRSFAHHRPHKTDQSAQYLSTTYPPTLHQHPSNALFSPFSAVGTERAS